ncbi:F-box/LRR-repeat protein At4g14103-like [Triticum dicoccoides]|uniref:F-box/LRR-repeat protein At4g14103-like n=1 Tax=Triticum dicoccoides TaxID=85692 RepID=UPI00188E38C7|nr:F-box/LRR-repeat protein At4g14103-like [Triticum dicoccoides]
MASGEDRISALPEDILHQVLRLLPAHEVVRTCLLARRWRGVWRSVPTLCFTGAKGWGSADRFAQFVDHLLHLRCGGDGAPLDSCDFDFDSDGFMLLPANERHASIWLWKALPRVRALRLCIVEEQEASPLSDMHLFSQHLTRLELVGVGVNNSVVDFAGCPTLVELSMDTCDVFVRQLLSPSLKHLRITRSYTSEFDRILISLPNLVSLEFIECRQGRVPFLGNLPRLARAVVVLNEYCADQCSQDRFDSCGADSDICDGCYYYYGDPGHGPHYDRNNCIFLKGLSEATDLELSAHSDVTVFNRDLKWCPTFTKLKTLLLNDWCLAADHNALICFLQHSPILEKLTLELSKGPLYETEAEGIYKPLGQSIASNCLKIVEIKCANVDSKVHKILEILTTYGIRLEQISIQQTSRIPGSGCFNFVCTEFS